MSVGSSPRHWHAQPALSAEKSATFASIDNTQIKTEINPEINTKINTEINTEINTIRNQKIDTEMNPEINTDVNPEINLEINLELKSKVRYICHETKTVLALKWSQSRAKLSSECILPYIYCVYIFVTLL